MKSKLFLGYVLVFLLYQVSINEGADIHDSYLENRLVKLESAFGQLGELEAKVATLEEQINLMEMRDAEKVEQIRSLEEKVTTLNMKETKEVLPGQDGVFVDSPDDQVQSSFLQKNINMEDGLEARVFGCEDDCCENLTNEINIIKTDIIELNQSIDDLVLTDETLNGRIDHFDDRLNDNTFNIVENQLQIQTDRKQTDKNMNNIDTNSHDIDTHKNNIDTNTNNIDTNTNNIDTNTDNIDTNKNNIDINSDNIDTNKNNININRHDISTNTETMETSTNLHISQCGYKFQMLTTDKITYDKLVTDVNSLNRSGLDIGTGVFTAPTHGTYLINIHFLTYWTGSFYAKPYKNGIELTDLLVDSRSNNNDDADSCGKTFTLELGENDKLHVQITEMTGRGIYETTFCATLIK